MHDLIYESLPAGVDETTLPKSGEIGMPKLGSWPLLVMSVAITSLGGMRAALACQNQSSAQQIQPSTTEHSSFDHFQAIIPSLDRPITHLQSYPSFDRLIIFS